MSPLNESFKEAMENLMLEGSLTMIATLARCARNSKSRKMRDINEMMMGRYIMSTIVNKMCESAEWEASNVITSND